MWHSPCRDASAGPRAAGALGPRHGDGHPQQCWPWAHQPAFLWGHVWHFKGQEGCPHYISPVPCTEATSTWHGTGISLGVVGVNPEDLLPRWPLLLCQLIPAGSVLPASLQPLSWRAGKKKKKLWPLMFLCFFFFFNCCLVKLPHQPQILLCLIFFLFFYESLAVQYWRRSCFSTKHSELVSSNWEAPSPSLGCVCACDGRAAAESTVQQANAAEAGGQQL